MSTMDTPSVLVMAKAPRPGRLRTRPHCSPSSSRSPSRGHLRLSPLRCAALQAELIRHTLELTTARGLRTYLAYDPGEGEDTCDMAPPGVRPTAQRGDGLGQRLTHAVEEAFADGAGPLLVIGTDAPTLTGDHLAAAFTALERHDVALGPALDGGYYLIGMRRPHARLFALDEALWGTEHVLTATRARAAEDGLSTELLCPLRDLDTAEDAAALLADPQLPFRIAALLQPEEAV